MAKETRLGWIAALAIVVAWLLSPLLVGHAFSVVCASTARETFTVAAPLLFIVTVIAAGAGTTLLATRRRGA